MGKRTLWICSIHKNSCLKLSKYQADTFDNNMDKAPCGLKGKKCNKVKGKKCNGVKGEKYNGVKGKKCNGVKGEKYNGVKGKKFNEGKGKSMME